MNACPCGGLPAGASRRVLRSRAENERGRDTAETLMRSRRWPTSWRGGPPVPHVDPLTRPADLHLHRDPVDGLGLDSTVDGGPEDEHGIVEFTAAHASEGRSLELHEVSEFARRAKVLDVRGPPRNERAAPGGSRRRRAQKGRAMNIRSAGRHHHVATDVIVNAATPAARRREWTARSTGRRAAAAGAPSRGRRHAQGLAGSGRGHGRASHLPARGWPPDGGPAYANTKDKSDSSRRAPATGSRCAWWNESRASSMAFPAISAGMTGGRLTVPRRSW
ncbi:hypothetical protein QJS66_21790 [Kocuria rhizophila]|nr:hypothetical protein QJS66_21790 [Kocuria rhizophila]